jgi:hypothetical protein
MREALIMAQFEYVFEHKSSGFLPAPISNKVWGFSTAKRLHYRCLHILLVFVSVLSVNGHVIFVARTRFLNF